ncbi:MAG: response regulator [Patescibacteria group bacterium]|nr:response regulator [Patescibacteria group bacterium]
MKKILIVEDDGPILNILSELLKAIGHEILTAENAEKGLEVFQNNKDIDVVLTDDAMPVEGDGCKLVAKIRHQLGFQGKIIMMSGTICEEMALTVGANCFLSKPFLPKEIFSAVQ